MRRVLGAVVLAVLCACSGASSSGNPGRTQPEGEHEGSAVALGTLQVQRTEGGLQGTYTQGEEVVHLRSRRVEEGVYRVEVRVNGMTLSGLLDVEAGVSALDGFAELNGVDTQMGEEDRERLMAVYQALNAELPAGAVAAPEVRYLRRAVGLWAQQPSTVELQRTVMGEQGRGYTMLCSYARCGGSYTGSCSTYNWYSYAKHDCDRGGFEYTRNQQIAQLGDHFSCSGDEFYWSNSTWVCGEPDHWSRPYVVGNCFGRCGGGCGGDTQYTLDATNHDGCVRNGHALASMYCNDQFTSASDDELFAPDCY